MWNSEYTYIATIESIKEWSIFKNVADDDVRQIKAMYVFNTRNHSTCHDNSSGAIFLTKSDVTYCLGHNCKSVNFFGLSINNDRILPHDVKSPMVIPGLSGISIVDVAIGGTVGAAVTATGQLLWWGRCYLRETGPIICEPHAPVYSQDVCFKKVVCGDQMVVGLSTTHSVYVWGFADLLTYVPLDGVQIPMESPVADISCGLYHAALLTQNGTVFVWSRNTTKGFCVTPISAEKCVAVKCGHHSTFCLTEHFRIKTCGPLLQMVDVGLSNIKEMAVIRCDIEAATIVVTSAGVGWLYTWGKHVSWRPSSSSTTSFFREFKRNGVTPGLLQVYIQPSTSIDFVKEYQLGSRLQELPPAEFRPRSRRIDFSKPALPDLLKDTSYTPASKAVSKKQTVHQERKKCTKTITSGDVLTYLYLRDRPELAEEYWQFLAPFDHRELQKSASASFDTGESGRNLIMSKFISSILEFDYSTATYHEEEYIFSEDISDPDD